jgi:hypothetical protein
LAALSTKYGEPSLAVFRSNLVSFCEFFRTDSMPLAAAARVS